MAEKQPGKLAALYEQFQAGTLTDANSPPAP